MHALHLPPLSLSYAFLFSIGVRFHILHNDHGSSCSPEDHIVPPPYSRTMSKLPTSSSAPLGMRSAFGTFGQPSVLSDLHASISNELRLFPTRPIRIPVHDQCRQAAFVGVRVVDGVIDRTLCDDVSHVHRLHLTDSVDAFHRLVNLHGRVGT